MEKFVLARSPMMVLDESDAIKGPQAKQTRAITTVGKRAPMRRIATGTPVADGPFDVFSQMRFLDKDIFGITSFMAFKHEYGVFEKRFVATHSFQQLVALSKFAGVIQGAKSAQSSSFERRLF